MLIRILPFVFAMLWSTGFIGAKYGLPYIGPYTFLMVRFLITLLLFVALLAVLKPRFPTTVKAYVDIAYSGVLIHVAYLGGVFTAINLGLPAGITAVIVGLQPIITTLLIHRLNSPLALITTFCGFFGLLLVVVDRDFQLSVGMDTLVPCIVALVGITFGTLYQKKHCTHINILVVAFVQYIPTVLVFFALSLIFESEQTIIWHSELIFALAWLIVVLSIGAILLMSLLYKNNSPSIAANYFYLAPPFTLLQGYLFFDEAISLINLSGIVLVVVSIYLTRTMRAKV